MAQRNDRHMTRTQLKELRLKPAPGQQPVDRYWSNRSRVYRDLYDADKAVPMREYRPPSEAQKLALEKGRYIAATVECMDCKGRFYPYDMRGRYCLPCNTLRLKKEASDCARGWLELDPIFIDLETTGLCYDSEVIEIAILDKIGNCLFETLIKPSSPILEEATAINGITNSMVEKSPSFVDVADEIAEIIKERKIIAHNASFDFTMLFGEFRRCGKKELFPTDTWFCTMKLLCDQNEGRYPSLHDSMAISCADLPGEGVSHRAKFDANCCRRIVLKLADQ